MEAYRYYYIILVCDVNSGAVITCGVDSRFEVGGLVTFGDMAEVAASFRVDLLPHGLDGGAGEMTCNSSSTVSSTVSGEGRWEKTMLYL